MVVDPLAPLDLASLGHQDFTVRVGPVRRAFLVSEGDAGQLRFALQAAMAIWGGGRCPIISVAEDGNLNAAHIQIAEVLGVTRAIDFTGGRTDRTEVPWPVAEARPLTDANFWSLHPGVVVPSGFREIFLPADETLLSLAGAGTYGLAEEAPLFRDAGFNVIERCDPDTVAQAQLGERTAWAATLSYDIDTVVHNPSLRSIALLWVVDDPNSFQDAVWFWNDRALRPRLAQETVAVIASRDTVTSEAFREAFTSAVRRTSSTTPSFVISSDSIETDELAALAEALGASHHDGNQLQERLGRVEPNRALTYLVDFDVRTIWLSTRLTGPARTLSASLRRPTLVVEGTSGVTWVPRYLNSGNTKVTITSPSISGPRKISVARLYMRAASWDREALAFETWNAESFRFHLGLPVPSEVLQAAVSSSGVTYALSDKGQQLLGASRLTEDLSLFRRRSVHALVSTLTRTANIHLARELAAYRAEKVASEKTIEALKISALLGDRPYKTIASLLGSLGGAGIGKGDAGTAIDDLVACGAAEMGMAARCPLCSLREFQTLATIDGPPTCRGCGARAVFTAGKVDRPEVHYRLNSLVHTLSLNGGMAPLSAYALLGSEGAFTEPGVNLHRDGRQVGELDLLGWKGASLFAAEAKSSTAGFDKADVAADVEKAALVGADTFIMVCAEEVSAEAFARAQDACGDLDIELRVMNDAHLLTDG